MAAGFPTASVLSPWRYAHTALAIIAHAERLAARCAVGLLLTLCACSALGGPGRDSLYSVAALTDASGSVVERYRYDAYGKRTVLAGDGVTVRAGSAYGQQRGLSGYYIDGETSLLFGRVRYLSPGLGRFLTRNFWGEPLVTSPYHIQVVSAGYRPIILWLNSIAEGTFIQHRFGHYDYALNCPSNFVEPYSPPGEAVEEPPRDPGGGETSEPTSSRGPFESEAEYRDRQAMEARARLEKNGGPDYIPGTEYGPAPESSECKEKKPAEDKPGDEDVPGKYSSFIDRQEFNKERSEYWKNEAKNNSSKYSQEDLARMREGRPPIGPDGYPMELHHLGGNPAGPLVPMTRTDHRLGENYLNNHPWLGR